VVVRNNDVIKLFMQEGFAEKASRIHRDRNRISNIYIYIYIYICMLGEAHELSRHRLHSTVCAVQWRHTTTLLGN